MKTGRCWIEVVNNTPQIQAEAEFIEEYGEHNRQTADYIAALVTEVLDPKTNAQADDWRLRNHDIW